MSDHYCCKQCGLRYDDCRCVRAPAPPNPNLAKWYVVGPGFEVKLGKDLEDWQRMRATSFATKKEAELHSYQSIGSRMVELSEELNRLKALRDSHPANKSRDHK